MNLWIRWVFILLLASGIGLSPLAKAQNKCESIFTEAVGKTSTALAVAKLIEIAERYRIPYSLHHKPDGTVIPVLLLSSSTSIPLASYLKNSIGTQSLLLPNFPSDHGQFRYRDLIIDLADPGSRVVNEIHSTGLSWRGLSDYLKYRTEKSNALVETSYVLTKEELSVVEYYHRVRRAAIYRTAFSLNGRRILIPDQSNTLNTKSTDEHCFAYSKGSTLSAQIAEVEGHLAKLQIRNIENFIQRPQVQTFLSEAKIRLFNGDPMNVEAMNPHMHRSLLNDEVSNVEVGNWVLAWDAVKQYQQLIRSLEISNSSDAPGDFNNPRASAILVYGTEAQAQLVRTGRYPLKGSDNLILKTSDSIPVIDPFTAFPESRYGLSDSSRKGHSHFAKWAAGLTRGLMKNLQAQQVQPQDMFFNIMQERIEFAKTFEGMADPSKEGFGESRVRLGKYEQSEERVGVINRPSRDYAYPEEVWQRIAKISSRTDKAHEVLDHVVKANLLKLESLRSEVILDRTYETLDGTVIKLSSTKVKPLTDTGTSDPTYLVSLLNAPKSNVDLLMKDVHERISIVLKSKENTDVNREHLIRAMQGYFCAMPYYRGSGAVGRIAFTALFSALKQEQVTLHPEVDIKALSLEYEAFKNSFELSRQEYPSGITSKLQSYKVLNKARSAYGAIKRFFSF